MGTLHYFAYGSNLHPLRLQERVPSAEVIGVVAAGATKLTFSKIGNDQSGKCSIHPSDNPEDTVFGVLYQMNSRDKAKLDKVESKGHGYDEHTVSVELAGQSYRPFTYVADSRYVDVALQPYEWYKQFVIVGARYHGMPRDYISWLESIEANPDPDAARATENSARLHAMKDFNALTEGPNCRMPRGKLLAQPRSTG